MNSPTFSPLSATPFPDGPRLLADIGGTNARFALEIAPHVFSAVQVLPCNDYAQIADALDAYLATSDVVRLTNGRMRHAALAIANPVENDRVRMTNHHWEFSIDALRARMNFDTLVVVNDFTALAMALPHLSAAQTVQVGGGHAHAGRTIGLIGAGTGLGVSGIIPSGKRWVPLSSEGGHVSFSPIDELEVAILRYVWRDFSHVSAERLLSGPGLELLYRALAACQGTMGEEDMPAAEITRRAAAGTCPLCRQTIETFCAMLGTVAGNLAITLGATGGMYIGGGIVPRLGPLFEQSAFRARFEAKGRFAGYLAQIPTFVITEPYPAFLGVSAILEERITSA
jgi:glucokinase